jgi:hypothetical protein
VAVMVWTAEWHIGEVDLSYKMTDSADRRVVEDGKFGWSDGQAHDRCGWYLPDTPCDLPTGYVISCWHFAVGEVFLRVWVDSPHCGTYLTKTALQTYLATSGANADCADKPISTMK